MSRKRAALGCGHLCCLMCFSDGPTRHNQLPNEDLMNRSIENRLQKLEQTDGKVVLIAFGPDETAEEASERYFQRNPQHRTAARILLINTGVTRHRDGWVLS